MVNIVAAASADRGFVVEDGFSSVEHSSIPWVDQVQAMPYTMSLPISVSFWAVLLIIIWLLPVDRDLKRQGADRILSTIHAILTSMLGIYAELSTVPACTTKGTWLGVPLLIFLGYVVVDSVSMLVCDVWRRWRTPDYGMMFHHVFIFTFFTLGYVTDTGLWFGTTLLVNEISTPFLNLFWYLGYTAQKESRAFFVNALVLLAAFTLCRMLFIPYNFYQLVSLRVCLDSPNPTYSWGAYVMVFGYGVLYLMNGVWYFKLVKGACKKFFPGGGTQAVHSASDRGNDSASDSQAYERIK